MFQPKMTGDLAAGSHHHLQGGQGLREGQVLQEGQGRCFLAHPEKYFIKFICIIFQNGMVLHIFHAINSLPGDTPGGYIPDAGCIPVGCILADSTPAGSDTPGTEPPLPAAAADCCILGLDSRLLARQCRHIRRQHQEALGCASGLHSMICVYICHM